MGSGAEFDVIRGFLAIWGDGAQGIGDDAAIMDIPQGERLVVSTDACVEHVHFRREWMTPEEIGARATAAALSDLAAMAATPRGLLVALGVSDAWRAELPGLAAGVGTAAAAAQCIIVGGNLSAAGELSLTMTVFGSAVRPLMRAGAREGDIIFVTGRLGGAGAALGAMLDGRAPSADARARFVGPVPRLREARWLEEHGARAAIDISDGLIADAAHLARASGVSIELNEHAVPCFAGVTSRDALASGEEYELLVAMPPSHAISTNEFERLFGIPLTAIGIVVRATDPVVTIAGSPGEEPAGHDHFASPAR